MPKKTMKDIKKVKSAKTAKDIKTANLKIAKKNSARTKPVKKVKNNDFMVPLESKPINLAQQTSSNAASQASSIIEQSSPALANDKVETLSQPKLDKIDNKDRANQSNLSNHKDDNIRDLGTLASIEDDQKHTMGTKTALFGSKKIISSKPQTNTVQTPTVPNSSVSDKSATGQKNNGQSSNGTLEPIEDLKSDASKDSGKQSISIPQEEPHHDENASNPAANRLDSTDKEVISSDKKEKNFTQNKDFFISNIDSGDIKMETENTPKESTDKPKPTVATDSSQTPHTDKKPQDVSQKTPPKAPQAKGKKKSFWDFLTKSYGKNDSEFIIQNLALFLTSGINIMTSLEAMKGETKNQNLKDNIDELKQAIEDGTPLWRALADLKLASENTVALIKIGEESGKLTENLNVIANQQQKDRSFRSKVLSAMLYPVLVMGMTVVVGLGIAWFILPRLASVFSSMKMQLPWITKAIIWLGKFLSVWGLIAVPAIIILLGVIFYFIFIYSKTKHIGQAILFAIPGIKDVLLQVEITRFGYVLGTLLDAGIPIATALGSLKESTTTYIYKNIYTYFTKAIEEGNSFQKCFQSYPKVEKYIPTPVQQMIISAEQSGTLGITLKKIGEIYEEKTDFSTKNLATIIEPILLFIVWGAVLIVALAVIIPIYGLVGGMNQASKNTQTASGTTSTETSATQSLLPEETPSIEPTITTQPTETPTIQPTEAPTVKKVKILSTETGYLNVRSEPSTSGTIVGTVNPGDEFEYEEIQNDWYKIKINPSLSGWVSGEYVEQIQ